MIQPAEMPSIRGESPGRPVDHQIAALAGLIQRSRRIVVLTGAGISTESGIPDYRGPGGVWESGKPPTIRDFLGSEAARREYWRLRAERYPALLASKPNAAHSALVILERAGSLDTIVTQNVDGLHQAAGSDPNRVVELHGTAHRVCCAGCQACWTGLEIQRRLESGDEFPSCTRCGGILRTATILFGEPLPAGALDRALKSAESCDAMLVVGSSLVVNPAARLPAIAKRGGASLAIVNRTATKLDNLADVRIAGSAGEVLPVAIQRACSTISDSQDHPL